MQEHVKKNFRDLIKDQKLLDYLDQHQLFLPTLVQEKSLEQFAPGKSLNIISPTGSGKTLSYLLPLFQELKKIEMEGGELSPFPKVLIMAPTRELASQILSVAKNMAHFSKLRCRAVEELGRPGKKGSDVVVGVAGKIREGMRKRTLILDHLRAIVFDEADQLLDPTFVKDSMTIYHSCPTKSNKFQVFLVGATTLISEEDWKKKIFPSVAFVDIDLGESALRPYIETFNIFVSGKEKLQMLEEFLKREAKGPGIVFINKKEDADVIFAELQKKFPTKNIIKIHGGVLPGERERAFKVFSEKGEILVASDIMARGIDLLQLEWAFNYDLPFEASYYVHRAGRVGRKSLKGKVYNLVTGKDQEVVKRINKAILSQTALKLGALKLHFANKKSTNNDRDKNKLKTESKTQSNNKKVSKKAPIKKQYKASKVVKRSPRFARKKK